jgi:hypothetical protein
MKEYRYTLSEWLKISNYIQHFEEGDKIFVYNSMNDHTDEYTIEIRKVATRKKRWDEE